MHRSSRENAIKYQNTTIPKVGRKGKMSADTQKKKLYSTTTTTAAHTQRSRTQHKMSWTRLSRGQIH